MKKLCAAFFGLLLASAAQAQVATWPPPAGSVAFLCVYNSTPPTLANTNVGFAQCDSAGSLRISGTFTPSGTQDVNLIKVNGNTALAGNGITGTGSPRVTIASDNTAFSVNAIQSGTWTVTGAGGTFPVTQSTSPWVVSLASTTITGTVGVTQSTSPWVVSNSGTFPVQATLAAETTKVIGTVNQGTSPWVVSGTTTASAPVGITPTDRTITSASGASQQLAAANASRHSLTITNTGNANCGVNPTGGTAAIGGAGTLTLAPLGAYTPRIPSLSAVTVICTAGQSIYGDEN